MPKITVRNDAPTLKVRNTDIPVVGIREQSFVSNPVTLIQTGMPIGLLLVLTYADNFTTGQFSTIAPRVRIRNTD